MELNKSTPTPLKRVREEEAILDQQDDFKRQKSYKDIITLLEEDEDYPNEDLSSIISTLQEELSSGSEPDPEKPELQDLGPGSVSVSGSEEEEGEKVMRHLLEASDDELGIPSTDGFDSSAGEHVDGGDLLFPVGESLWEFEDHEAANYYNLLQSEVFM